MAKLLRFVPALHHRVDVDALVLAHGDERIARDEHADLARVELTRDGVERERVGVYEQVRVVAVELRALMLVDGILDGQRVQLQLLGDRRQLLAGRFAVVEPHERVRFGDVVGDFADREVLAVECAVLVEPRASHGAHDMGWEGQATPPGPVYRMTDANLIPGEGDAVFARMRKTGFGLLALGSALMALFFAVAVANAAAAPPTYNLQGTWTSGPLSGGVRSPANGTQTVTQMDMTTGAFSGHSVVEEIPFELSGTESGSAVEFTQTEGGYTAHDKIPALSILPDGKRRR